MNWEVEQAREGSYTLKANGIYLYSKYYPKKDAVQFIQKEIDPCMIAYLLIGLGLGYHIDALLSNTSEQAIFVLPIDQEELKLYEKFGNKQLLTNKRIQILETKQTSEILSMEGLQIIIPIQWIKAIGQHHPLFSNLEDIKIRQMSYQTSKILMDENFKLNIGNYDTSIIEWKQRFEKKNACLVSAGPSLEHSIELLKVCAKKCFVLCVGSALKAILKQSIVPDAVIITDPSPLVIEQIRDTDYQGPLFYLSTANNEMTQIHLGERFIIFQEGYADAEEIAKKQGVSLIETGGSVATTALSLLEYIGFQEVYLFGQDLGFAGSRTHANDSTSGIDVAKNARFRQVVANSGKLIKTTPNLNTYHRWFEQKAKTSSMQLFNTAWNGAKIEGIPYINERKIEELIHRRKL